MTDRIPNTKIDRSKTVEEAAKFKDVADRARIAKPVTTGVDILRGHSGAGTEIL